MSMGDIEAQSSNVDRLICNGVSLRKKKAIPELTRYRYPSSHRSESGHFISGCIMRGRNVGDTGTVLYEWINGVPDQAGNT